MTERPKQYKTTIDQHILGLIEKHKPESTEELVELFQQTYPIAEQEILKHILRLQDEGKIVMHGHSFSLSFFPSSRIFSASAKWYWRLVGLSVVTLALIILFQEEAYLFVYIRYVMGTLFVLFLPGYSFMKVLFPGKKLNDVEGVTMSMGMSLAIVPIVGLLLNYTPLGIRIVPVTSCLFILTILLSTVAIIRESRVDAYQ